MINREVSVMKVVESLENNMELLGITGVEDKLQ
jgi:magnesium-transporting ATPase (P-type)